MTPRRRPASLPVSASVALAGPLSSSCPPTPCPRSVSDRARRSGPLGPGRHRRPARGQRAGGAEGREGRVAAAARSRRVATRLDRLRPAPGEPHGHGDGLAAPAPHLRGPRARTGPRRQSARDADDGACAPVPPRRRPHASVVGPPVPRGSATTARLRRPGTAALFSLKVAGRPGSPAGSAGRLAAPPPPRRLRADSPPLRRWSPRPARRLAAAKGRPAPRTGSPAAPPRAPARRLFAGPPRPVRLRPAEAPAHRAGGLRTSGPGPAAPAAAG